MQKFKSKMQVKDFKKNTNVQSKQVKDFKKNMNVTIFNPNKSLHGKTLVKMVHKSGHEK